MKVYGLIAIILTHILLPGCTKVSFNTEKYYMCLGKADEHYYQKKLTPAEKECFAGVISNVSNKIKISKLLKSKFLSLANRNRRQIEKSKPWVGGYIYFSFYNTKSEIILVLAASPLYQNKIYIVEGLVKFDESRLTEPYTSKEYELVDKELFQLLQEVVHNTEIQELKDWNCLELSE